MLRVSKCLDLPSRERTQMLLAAGHGTEAAMLTTITGGRVARIASYATAEHGLAQLRDPAPIEVSG